MEKLNHFRLARTSERDAHLKTYDFIFYRSVKLVKAMTKRKHFFLLRALYQTAVAPLFLGKKESKQ